MEKKITLFFIILITAFCYPQNRNGVHFVRKNANSPEAKADLEAMNVAFKKMREMGCEKGLSWYYQGAIHNIPPAINGKNNLCAEYQTMKDKLWAWGDCTHDNSESADLHFLLWHRMYIWHLEKIVRELSGKKDFALPYWNYGSPDNKDNFMAEPMREKQTSLYAPARYSILNNGKPLLSGQVKEIHRSITELKTNPSFTGSAGFSQKIEEAPHGFMHVLIGGGYASPPESYYNEIFQEDNFRGLMGKVPSAGFDPVFWLHHSMIDRIWESWDASIYGQRPTLQELEANKWPYEFITPSGGHVVYTMKEVYDIVFNPDYEYDSLLYGSKTPVLAGNETQGKNLKNVISFQDSKEKVIWEKNIGKPIESAGFKHKVTSNFAKNTNKVFKNTANSKILLNLDLVVYKEPQDFYTVYLRYPGKEDEYVGTITFFGLSHDHGTGENHELAETGVKLKFSYYISDDLSRSGNDFEIIIKKTGEDNAKVTLEKIGISQIN